MPGRGPRGHRGPGWHSPPPEQLTTAQAQRRALRRVSAGRAGRERGRKEAWPTQRGPSQRRSAPWSDVTGLPAGAILKVESPTPAAAAAVAAVAAAAAATAAANTAGEGAREGTPRSESHHPAGLSTRAASLPPRSPSPPPSGAIRLHPRPRSPHPQVRGLSPGRGDPEEPGRTIICSATWQVKKKRPSAG